MSGRRFRRAAAAVSLLLGLAACATEPERTPSAGGQRPAPRARETVLPVALPDLASLEAPVQEQLREQFAVLTEKANAPGTPAPALAAAHGEMGKLLLAAKYYDRAEPFLLNAEVLDPREPRWPYYLGHLYKAQGALTPAGDAFERALEQLPDSEAALVWRGEVHLLDGEPAAAARLFGRAEAAHPRSLAAHFGLGRAALARENFREAVGHFEEVLALATQPVNVHYPLGLAYRGLGETARAEPHLRRQTGAEILPADPWMDELQELLRSAVSYELRGTRALNSGDWSTAAAQFREGLTLEPSNAALRHKLGTALFQLGDVRGARDAFERVVRTSPTYARAHYSLGVLLESEGRVQEALARFSAAITHEPAYADARIRLAELLRRAGRLEEARAEYGRVLAMDPRNTEAVFGQAMTLVSLGRYADARSWLTAAVQTHAGVPVLRHALARLLAAAPDARVRDGHQALAVMQALTDEQRRLDLGETMAMVYAELGRYQDAVEWQRGAMTAARRIGDENLVGRMRDSLRLYEAGRPSRTAWREQDLP